MVYVKNLSREIQPGLLFDDTLVDQNPPKMSDKSLDFGIKGQFCILNGTCIEPNENY